jgi:serine/threonine protein kinase
MMVAQIAAAEEGGNAEARKFWQEIAVRARRCWSSPRAPLPQDPPIAKNIGDYRVEGVLGRGGMGTVYRAKHRLTGARIALKTVAAETPHHLASLREEIACLESVQHPGIIRILEHGLFRGGPWYAMPLLDGETLEARHDAVFGKHRRNRVRGTGVRCSDNEVDSSAIGRAQWFDELRAYYARLCAPIAHLHALGLVHCDLKPANVFIQKSGEPILLDFGLTWFAREAVGRESLQVRGGLRGTLAYLAPELIRGAIPDARADLYSFGCMLYESICGSPPFQSANVRELLDMHIGAQPTALTDRARGVPAELSNLVTRLLSKLPADRPSDIERVAAALGVARPFEVSGAPHGRI